MKIISLIIQFITSKKNNLIVVNCCPIHKVEMIGPDVVKVARPVLRRGRASNRSSLFGGF